MTNRSTTEAVVRPSVDRKGHDIFNWSGPATVNGLLWAVAGIAIVLMLAACSGSDEPAGNGTLTPEDQVASGIATQQAIETQIAEGVAATAAAREEEAQPAPTTGKLQPTESPDSPTPAPTSEPPAPTEGTPPPAPTATPHPPKPTPTPEPPAPTPTPEPPAPTPSPEPTPAPTLPDPIVFERPETGSNFVSGANGTFAQGSGSWEVTAYPARAYVRSAVYFGISEDVQSHTRLYNTFVASQTGTVEVTVDVSWSGVFTTFGIGDMTSNLDLGLNIREEPDGGGKGTSLAEPPSIQPRDDREAVAGNESFQVIFDVEEGVTYKIEMRATCQSIGSRNGLASDTECIFDNRTGDGGYVEWSNLTVTYR